MSVAERNVRSLRRACRAVGFFAACCVAALGYCSVLLPDFFDSATPLLVRLLRVLALGSGLSFLTFRAFLHGYGAILERHHEEARTVVLRLMAARPTQAWPEGPQPSLAGEESAPAAAGGQELEDKVIPLPKAA